MSLEKSHEKGRTASVGPDAWFGVCVEIAAQCYGYVACSELAKKDKAVIDLAEDLRASRQMQTILGALEKIAGLPTDQLASPEQCSAVVLAMDALSSPNAEISHDPERKI